MILRALICCGLLASSTFAADQRKHRIDLKMDAASEKALSTADMMQVQAEGLKLWDAELNRVYGELKKKLKPAAFTALQAAQRDWLKYRDSQLKALEVFYGQLEGTMYRPMHAAAILAVTRARALELADLLEMDDLHGEE